MLQIFIELNLRILLVLLILGFTTGFLRRYTLRNLISKRHGIVLLDFFNLVGIPVHEFGHLIFGLLFGYRVSEACFYRTIKKSREHNGTLGYVIMNHKKDNPFQILFYELGQFFIGIGPLIFGPALILLLYHFLPVSIKSVFYSIVFDRGSVISYLQELSRTDILFVVIFIYIAIGISLNLELSGADLKLAWKGAIFLELLFLLISFICYSFSFEISDILIQISGYLILISSIGIAGSLLSSLLSFIG